MKLTKQRPDTEWEKEITKAEKTQVHRKVAQKMYAEKTIKDGQLFCITGATVQRPGGEEQPAWAIGAFVAGKLLYAAFPLNDRRLKRLKRQAVARILDTVKRGWVDTRTMPWLPRRYQNLKNPALVLHGPDNLKDDFESPAFKKDQRIFGEDEPFLTHEENESLV